MFYRSHVFTFLHFVLHVYRCYMFCIRVLPLFYIYLFFTRLHFFVSFMLFTCLFSVSHCFYLFYRLCRLHFHLTCLFLHFYICHLYLVYRLYVFTFFTFLDNFYNFTCLTLFHLFFCLPSYIFYICVPSSPSLFFCTFLPFLQFLFV